MLCQMLCLIIILCYNLNMSDLNKLFETKECKRVMKRIAAENDFRMCLNKSAMECYRRFFANVIMLNFVFDVLPSHLNDVYENVKDFTEKQFCQLLKQRGLKCNTKQLEKLLNKILGKVQYVFHGTTSAQEVNLKNMQNCFKFVKPYVQDINEIYENHNIYLAFQGGIHDFNLKNFWATTSLSSASFYALQSPEFFARFASRSDYYKTDVFKYDRIGYYRKDYFACKRNLITEMNEFCFSKDEKRRVLTNFKKIWDVIVEPDMKSIILYSANKKDNKHHFEDNTSAYDMILEYFKKLHFVCDLKKFNQNTEKIVLPNVKDYLKRQTPHINKKFVFIGGKKVFPDFYVDHKYSEPAYYIFDKNKNIINLFSGKKVSSIQEQIEFMNLAKPNSKMAKNYLSKCNLPSVDDVIDYYRQKLSDGVKELKKKVNKLNQINTFKYIIEDVGIKFVVSAKYHKFFKEVGQYEVYQLRKFLGVKLFEHYGGIVEITNEKLSKLQKLYENILCKTDEILKEDIPLKIFKGEIEVSK